MYSRNSFGSFYPVDSSVHRLNPVVKLFNFIVAILLIILSDSLYINLFLFSLVLCMELLSFVPFKYYFRTFWSLRYIYLLIVFICPYFRLSMTDAFTYLIKLITIVQYFDFNVKLQIINAKFKIKLIIIKTLFILFVLFNLI